MENVIDKIQTLLADEDSLKQIQKLYEMLSNGSSSGKSDEVQSKSECEHENTGPECAESDNVESNGEPFSSGDDMGFDFSTLLKLQSLFGNTSGSDDKNIALLTALKPHLSEEKQYKVDKAVKIMHLLEIYSVLKESGLLKDIDKML